MKTKKMSRSESGKRGAEATHKKRYEAIKELSGFLNKHDLNWVQAKWKTEHLLKLLEAYQHNV
mgnify:CR=1 FL=1